MYHLYQGENLVKVNPIYSLSYHSHGLRFRQHEPKDIKNMRWAYLTMNFKNIMPLLR